ncbi:hypothetical protein Snoj_29030 [Streptomyces nojiriensis]|uniref:Peptidase M4 domain-containing protein n=1 Tax=Streptomyces nojiriensis TaxID=66374 RepID=A0ABQ3SMC4_9ACTN|nr:hypothetical protein [Streptomyces nojiriensis]QTI42578.1 Protease PrtS [Streptomyces nojiriensis]GGS35625.1 hypothetical protein GCM10010205_77140 [Streptomyces nojiriensis]GHI68985.1 hypothetical protein Snoj_29030 [Streptomyces nojiriensis]
MLTRTGWESHGAMLARQHKSPIFEVTLRGYEALEMIPYSVEGEIPERVRDDILSEAAQRLVDAINALGEAGKVSKDQIQESVRRLQNAQNAATSLRLPPGSGVVPPPLVQERVLAENGEWWLSVDMHVEVPETRPRLSTPATAEMQHIVYDAQGRQAYHWKQLPVLRKSGDEPVGDPAIDDAYDGLVAASTFLRESFDRDFIGKPGVPIRAIVHFGKNFRNAAWDGQAVLLGDGDDQTFSRFSKCVEVIAMEVFKGLPELSPLSYSKQSGAVGVST